MTVEPEHAWKKKKVLNFFLNFLFQTGNIDSLYSIQ